MSLGLISAALLTGCSTGTESGKREYTRTERARMLVDIANGALLDGDPTGALQNLARAELEDASLPELYHSRALAYSVKHDSDKAILSAQKAVRIKSDYSDANNTLGRLLLNAGKYDEAEQYLKLAAHDSLYRESYKAWTSLGILNYKKSEYTLSKEYLNRAIQDAPEKGCIAYYYLGNIELKNKQLKEAISYFSKATRKFCVSFGDAELALGMAYEQDHQFQVARRVFLEVQKRYPNTPLAEQALEQLRYLP